jgi:hypothetical protein
VIYHLLPGKQKKAATPLNRKWRPLSLLIKPRQAFLRPALPIVPLVYRRAI